MPLTTGLKEWASVCDALETGRQILLLRKGGIHDVEGVFELEERRFVLFPTYLHQQPGMVKSTEQHRLVAMETEPQIVRVSSMAEVSTIVKVPNRAAADAIFDEHIYAVPQIDMRFNYKPNHPLYLVLLRTFVFERPVELENTAEFAGCKSWVPLDRDFEGLARRPVLSDDAFSERQSGILRRVGV